MSQKRKAVRAYQSWLAMRARCLCPENRDFSRYGGRGITICKRWASFEAFFVDMGDRPVGLTLERVDNNGNYCPENCKWATRKEQVRNRTVSKFIEHDGERLSYKEWAQRLGGEESLIRYRIKAGWPPSEAVTMPLAASPASKFKLRQRARKVRIQEQTKCTACKKLLPVSSFYKRKGRLAVSTKCKACSVLAARKWKKEHPEKVSLANERYRNKQKSRTGESENL